MSDDLLKRLRDNGHSLTQRERSQAAARIEALEREIAAERALADKAIAAEQARATAAEAALAAANAKLDTLGRLLSADGVERSVTADALENNGAPDWLSADMPLVPVCDVKADREALIAATLEQAAMIADHIDTMGDDGSGKWIRDEIRALATQPQTDALAARDAKMRAEGMRMAAKIAVPVERSTIGHQSEFAEGARHASWRINKAILAAAEKEAGHD